MNIPAFEILLTGTIDTLMWDVKSDHPGLRMLVPLIHSQNLEMAVENFFLGKGLLDVYGRKKTPESPRAAVAFLHDQHLLENQPQPGQDEVQVYNFHIGETGCSVLKTTWYAQFLSVYCRVVGRSDDFLRLERWLAEHEGKADGSC